MFRHRPPFHLPCQLDFARGIFGGYLVCYYSKCAVLRFALQQRPAAVSVGISLPPVVFNGLGFKVIIVILCFGIALQNGIILFLLGGDFLRF